MAKLLKFTLGVSISLVCVYLLYLRIDVAQLRVIFSNIRYVYIAPSFLIGLLLQYFIGLRYRFLVENKISSLNTFIINLISNASNLVLPLRGGEFLKIFLTKKHFEISYINIFMRILIEKYLDVYFSMLLGFFSLTVFIFNSTSGGIKNKVFVNILLVAGIFLFFSPLFFLLIKLQLQKLLRVLEKIFEFVRLKNLFEKKVKANIVLLHNFINWRYLSKPVYMSFFCWFFVHSFSFYLIGKVLSIHFNFMQASFLTFSAAMGLAIPSAPSGIGVLHAALTSSMILLGFSMNESVAFALLFHTLSTTSLGMYGLCAWFYSLFTRRRESGGMSLTEG